MPRWYYMRDENEYGPLKEEVIRTLMRRGKLDDLSQVRVEGSSEWANLGDSALALPPTEEVEAALPQEPDVVPVPPAPELMPSKFMPPECALSALLAIVVFTCEIVLLAAMLPSLIAVGFGSDGQPLQLPEWMMLERDGFGSVIAALAPWQWLLVAIHFGVVIMWHSATADMPPLLGAEVVHFSAGSAWWWAVPGANLLMPLRALRETWNLSRNPRAWSYGSMTTNPALMVWWAAFLGAIFFRAAQYLLIANDSAVRGAAREEHLKGLKTTLTLLQSGFWILHLAFFIYIVVVLYQRQSAQLKGTAPVAKRRRRL
jgi:GYF domain 2